MRQIHAENERLRAEVAELRERAARAERQLHAAGAVLAATIESLPFDFWARDREGYCFSQNSTALANWGDLRHRRPEDMEFPPEVIATWLANNRRALAGEIVRGDVEYTIRGERRYVENILAPIRMDDAIVGTLGVNVDVTERTLALQALRESDEKLRLAVDAAGVGLWSWDPLGDRIVWEPGMSAIFGLPPDGSPAGLEAYLALLHPEDRGRTAARIASGMEASRWEDEYRIVRADGAVRWLLTKGTVVREREGTRLVGAVIDVTERRERDEQLRQAQKLEAVGQLTAGLAHNFNNLLMGILPNVEIAARRAPAELSPLLEIAVDSARRAAELVRHLMTYAGRNRPRARVVEDVGPLVHRAVELCRPTFERRIPIGLSVEPDVHALVDAAQIEQAVLNVLINARDALDQRLDVEPSLEVSVALVRAGGAELRGRNADHVRVRIEDNGAGMDAATAARMYEPFFTTKAAGKGTGLGLTTTQAIVRDHGGFIVSDSAPGRGTTFSLYVPHEPEPPTEPAASREPTAPNGTETLLVVDDEDAVRRVVSHILGSAGYRVLEAPSGLDALALLASPEVARTVAVVVLDVSMPGPTSRELRARLRELTRARILYFTGHAFDAVDVDAGDAVLEKPVSERQLLQKVRQVIDQEA